jgi:hypothetical protein
MLALVVGTFAYPTIFCEKTCASEEIIPTASAAAAISSVFVLIFLVIFLPCVRSISQIHGGVSTFF